MKINSMYVGLISAHTLNLYFTFEQYFKISGLG
ncbi:hypothetical protein SAMN05443550_103159 [Pedobacter hartonius]|uniref:Uncharacterized protein n=1 Tax=Pedobacter hartonius TaxID=425514 RepID=A0A1H4B0B4_9SPHI|nr:hypothetical protein SAMN05443550_103159 [Pedobacter hartonius]